MKTKVNKKQQKKKEVNSEWIPVGKLGKRSMSGKDPVIKLHNQIKFLYPSAECITEVGVSEATNKYLQEQLIKLIRKEYPGCSKKFEQYQAGMAMLQYSPCTIPNAKDFVLYRRVGNV